MNKQQTLYLYGFLVILAGILIIGLRAESIHLLKCVMACCLIPAALFAFGTALKAKIQEYNLPITSCTPWH